MPILSTPEQREFQQEVHFAEVQIIFGHWSDATFLPESGRIIIVADFFIIIIIVLFLNTVLYLSSADVKKQVKFTFQILEINCE